MVRLPLVVHVLLPSTTRIGPGMSGWPGRRTGRVGSGQARLGPRSATSTSRSRRSGWTLCSRPFAHSESADDASQHCGNGADCVPDVACLQNRGHRRGRVGACGLRTGRVRKERRRLFQPPQPTGAGTRRPNSTCQYSRNSTQRPSSVKRSIRQPGKVTAASFGVVRAARRSSSPTTRPWPDRRLRSVDPDAGPGRFVWLSPAASRRGCPLGPGVAPWWDGRHRSRPRRTTLRCRRHPCHARPCRTAQSRSRQSACPALGGDARSCADCAGATRLRTIMHWS